MNARSDAFKDRLRLAMKDESVNSFAKRCGMAESVIRKYIAGPSLPGLDKLIAIAETSKANIEWLATGEGPKDKGSLDMEKIAPYHTGQPCERCSDNENAKLALYNAEPSAGNGTTFDDEHIVDWYPVSRKWLKEAGLNEKNLVVGAAKGDSMQPTIKDGDLLMLDRSKTEATAGVYVIRMSGELFVKRVQKNPIDNSVTIKSDNNTYDPIVAREDQLSMLDIVGKVVWIGSKA